MDVLKFCAESNPNEFLETVPEIEEAGIIWLFIFVFCVYKSRFVVRKTTAPIFFSTYFGMHIFY